MLLVLGAIRCPGDGAQTLFVDGTAVDDTAAIGAIVDALQRVADEFEDVGVGLGQAERIVSLIFDARFVATVELIVLRVDRVFDFAAELLSQLAFLREELISIPFEIHVFLYQNDRFVWEGVSSRDQLASLPLLQAAAYGGDALGVHAEPVHAAEVAGVFDLQAAVHHDRETGGFGDAGAFLVDHAVLTP